MRRIMSRKRPSRSLPSLSSCGSPGRFGDNPRPFWQTCSRKLFWWGDSDCDLEASPTVIWSTTRYRLPQCSVTSGHGLCCWSCGIFIGLTAVTQAAYIPARIPPQVSRVPICASRLCSVRRAQGIMQEEELKTSIHILAYRYIRRACMAVVAATAFSVLETHRLARGLVTFRRPFLPLGSPALQYCVERSFLNHTQIGMCTDTWYTYSMA